LCVCVYKEDVLIDLYLYICYLLIYANYKINEACLLFFSKVKAKVSSKMKLYASHSLLVPVKMLVVLNY